MVARNVSAQHSRPHTRLCPNFEKACCVPVSALCARGAHQHELHCHAAHTINLWSHTHMYGLVETSLAKACCVLVPVHYTVACICMRTRCRLALPCHAYCRSIYYVLCTSALVRVELHIEQKVSLRTDLQDAGHFPPMRDCLAYCGRLDSLTLIHH